MKSYEHDCGLITAYNHIYTPHENKQRNKQLQAKIQIGRYGVVILSSKGYDMFFIVDLKNTGKLGYDLSKWSQEYEQETIHFIPKGGIGSDRVFSKIDMNELKSKENDIQNYYEVANINGKWAMTNIANLDWRHIQV
jgi:hypothetical protein